MGKVKFRAGYNPPIFRKIAYGTWRTAYDPSVYSSVELDMTEALPWMDRYAQEHGVKITPVHLVAKAITHCMTVRPEINGMIRNGKVQLREDVAVFFQVNIPGTKAEQKEPGQSHSASHDSTSRANLSGAVLHGTQKMSLVEIAQGLANKAKNLREHKDAEFNKSMDIIRILPWWAMHAFLNLTSWLIYDLNLDLSAFGIPRDPFGSVMITNVGSMGVDIAWAPLCPYTRVPLLLAVGAIHHKPVAVQDRVEIRPILPIGVTFDHRLIDGVHAAHMLKEFRAYFAHPK